MRAAEFLTTLIKLVEKGELDTGEIEKAVAATGTMLSPLQQELEVAKHDAGIESVYNEEENSSEPRN